MSKLDKYLDSIPLLPESLLKIAVDYKMSGKLAESKAVAEALINRQNTPLIIRAEAHRIVGFYFGEKLDIKTSLSHYYRARKIFTQFNDAYKIARTDIEISVVHFYSNNFFESEKFVLRALKATENMKKAHIVRYLGNSMLALLYNDLQDYPTAIDYHHLALEKVSEIPNNQNLFLLETTLNNLGLSHQRLGQYETSIQYFKDALRSQKDFKKNPALWAAIVDNNAYSRMRSGNYRNVINEMESALEVRQRIEDIPGTLSSLIHLSEYYSLVKRDTIAKKIVIKAYDLARKHKLPAERMLCLQELIKVDKPNQHKYIQEYIKISDSLKTVERRNHNKFARIAFETDEIIKQKEEAELTERIYAGSALAFIVVMSLTFTTLYQRSKNKKLQLHKIQQEADAEIMKLLTVHQEEIAMAREDEKKRIGRELHDGVMNRLAGARIQLEKLAESQDDETIRKCLTHISQLHNIESDLRAVSHNLSRDNDATYLHFSNMLSTMVAQLAGDRENYITSKIKFNDWKSLSSTFKIGIYRILQEALGNCIKHSGADQIKLAITSKDNELRITVTDNGKGFQMDLEPDGIGLKNIKIRVRELNGKISITSEPGVGTKLSLAFSLKDHQEASQSKS